MESDNAYTVQIHCLEHSLPTQSYDVRRPDMVSAAIAVLAGIDDIKAKRLDIVVKLKDVSQEPSNAQLVRQ